MRYVGYVVHVVQGRICVYRKDPSSPCIPVLFAVNPVDKTGDDTKTLGCYPFAIG